METVVRSDLYRKILCQNYGVDWKETQGELFRGGEEMTAYDVMMNH